MIRTPASRYHRRARSALRALCALVLVLLLAGCGVLKKTPHGRPDGGHPASGAPVEQAGSGARGGEHGAPDGTDDGGLRLLNETHGAYTLRYPPGLEDDAREVGLLVDKVLASLAAGFARFDNEHFLQAVDLEVRIYAYPTEFAREGLATLQQTDAGDRTEAIVRMLAPSRHHGGTTSIGEPFDEDYFHKVLAHEIGTLYLVGINRLKKSGWAFHDAPGWFSEGFEEYIGLNFSNAHAREVTQMRYLDRLRTDPDRVALDLRVADAYRDGALIISFLRERYGIAALDDILRSERATFWEAVEDVTSLTPVSLNQEFHDWVRGAGRLSNAAAPSAAPAKSACTPVC